MSAFSFNTTYQPTGDQQKDAIAQIDIMQNRAVQANLAYRAADAADYVRETDRSLMQLVTAFWATLALMYVSLAAITGKYPVRPGKMKCVRVATADERLKEVLAEDTSLPGKIRECHVYFPDDRTIRNNGEK
ncbi:conjugal transfer protein TraP [Escherichia coli]|uniref:conjugal transfer protein TraP n=1 Tax=Escherichia coli TaxID=562 RepID=UPI000BB9B847|nr:conjugal transfer protein TraP [Escherichia coli]